MNRTKLQDRKAIGSGIIALQGNGEVLSEKDHKQRLADNVIVNPDGTATCIICNKVFSAKYSSIAISNARVHVESHIEGLNYSCEECGNTSRYKYFLIFH